MSLDDYVRLVERNGGGGGPTTSGTGHVPATRSLDTRPPPPAPEVPPRIAVRCRVPRIGDLIGEQVTTTPTTSAAEVSNIKLRLRPSIKRTRDMVRPVLVRKATEDKEMADSSLDMTGHSDTAATGTLDRRLRGQRANDTSRAEAETTPGGGDGLPKRRMSLRRSTRV